MSKKAYTAVSGSYVCNFCPIHTALPVVHRQTTAWAFVTRSGTVRYQQKRLGCRLCSATTGLCFFDLVTARRVFFVPTATSNSNRARAARFPFDLPSCRDVQLTSFLPDVAIVASSSCSIAVPGAVSVVCSDSSSTHPQEPHRKKRGSAVGIYTDRWHAV